MSARDPLRLVLPACGLISAFCGCISVSVSHDHEISSRDVGRAVRIGHVWHRARSKLTPEDEYAIGRAVAARILTEYAPFEDPKTAGYVRRVGASLTYASRQPEIYGGYRFLVLDSDEVNAFSAPGAFVFVTTGLLRCTADEGMLAAALAHEIAHLQNEDGLKLIRKRRWNKFAAVVGSGVAGTLVGGVIGDLTLVFGEIAEDLYADVSTRGYGEDLERQADADAVEMLVRVGYDPQAMVDLLRAMKQRSPGGRRGLTGTHPKTADRIRWIRPRTRRAPVDPPPPPERQRRYLAGLAAVAAP